VLLRRSELVATSFEDVKKSIASNRERFEATPSIWPASGFLSSTYSMRRRHPIFHDVRPHFGIDISANRGNPILATAAGRVVRAGWQNGHGNQVEIEHGHGVLTKYSHASKILVKPGQKVKRGDTIALVGSTGYAIAPHVHYEVHENGDPVDPLNRRHRRLRPPGQRSSLLTFVAPTCSVRRARLARLSSVASICTVLSDLRVHA
jgi:murein DD-endopeptidase MepM/ murein hydrolase activator NlpD